MYAHLQRASLVPTATGQDDYTGGTGDAWVSGGDQNPGSYQGRQSAPARAASNASKQAQASLKERLKSSERASADFAKRAAEIKREREERAAEARGQSVETALGSATSLAAVLPSAEASLTLRKALWYNMEEDQAKIAELTNQVTTLQHAASSAKQARENELIRTELDSEVATLKHQLQQARDKHAETDALLLVERSLKDVALAEKEAGNAASNSNGSTTVAELQLSSASRHDSEGQ